MSDKPTAAITDYFADLEDPRIERTKLHQLLDILVIAIYAIICGADDSVEVELFGNAKLPPSAVIGASKTHCTGYWTSPFTKIRAASAPVTLPRIFLCSTALPSTF